MKQIVWETQKCNKIVSRPRSWVIDQNNILHILTKNCLSN